MLFHFKRIELEKKLHTIVGAMPRGHVIPYNYDNPFLAEQLIRLENEMRLLEKARVEQECKTEVIQKQISALPSRRP